MSKEDKVIEAIAEKSFNRWKPVTWLEWNKFENEHVRDREREFVKEILSTLKEMGFMEVEEIKNLLEMVKYELCFGGNWEDAKSNIDKFLESH